MAYDPSNPPSLIGQGVGGTEGMRFFGFVWIDPIGDVLAPGYISNAADIGMRVGDSLVYKDTAGVGEWLENHLVLMEIDSNGAGTVAFPIIPEEALPEADTFDPDDMTQFLVLYQNGRQTRIQIGQFTPNAATIASKAEAEAGVDNEKRMTPLRTLQTIAAQAPGFVTAGIAAIGTAIAGFTGKTTPVDGDSLVISDSAASGVAKKLTFANLKAWVLSFTVQAGLVMFSPKGTIPAGWLACEGGTFVEADYPALFAYLGSTTLPDYRDRVLRGAGTLAGAVYTTQEDAFQGHNHASYSAGNDRSIVAGSLFAGVASAADNSTLIAPSGVSPVREAVSDGTNGTPRTTTETRVKAAIGKFVIKAH